MHESDTYLAILEEAEAKGLLKGTREVILVIGRGTIRSAGRIVQSQAKHNHGLGPLEAHGPARGHCQELARDPGYAVRARWVARLSSGESVIAFATGTFLQVVSTFGRRS